MAAAAVLSFSGGSQSRKAQAENRKDRAKHLALRDKADLVARIDKIHGDLKKQLADVDKRLAAQQTTCGQEYEDVKKDAGEKYEKARQKALDARRAAKKGRTDVCKAERKAITTKRAEERAIKAEGRALVRAFEKAHKNEPPTKAERLDHQAQLERLFERIAAKHAAIDAELAEQKKTCGAFVDEVRQEANEAFRTYMATARAVRTKALGEKRRACSLAAAKIRAERPKKRKAAREEIRKARVEYNQIRSAGKKTGRGADRAKRADQESRKRAALRALEAAGFNDSGLAEALKAKRAKGLRALVLDAIPALQEWEQRGGEEGKRYGSARRALEALIRGNRSEAASKAGKAAAEKRSESDDEVEGDLAANHPDLIPYWRKVRRGIKAKDRASRLEVFLEQAAEDPEGVYAAQEETTADLDAQLAAEQHARGPKSERRRKKAEPLSVACPECKAKPGNRCTNYKGKGCAPHRRRMAVAEGRPDPGPPFVDEGHDIGEREALAAGDQADIGYEDRDIPF